MKKTKIVATIGPASESEEVLKELFENGLDVCRLNFSHGTHEEHQKKMDTIKKVREEMGLPIPIMLDTKGPEIRLKDFKDGVVNVVEGDVFTLTSREVEGDNTIVSVSYDRLAHDVSVGNLILIDDGLVEMKVEEIDGLDIKCRVLNSGELKNHKGVNVPHVKINLPAVSERDYEDLLFGIENDIDFIAASFVRHAGDILEIRKVLEEHGGEGIEIIAKIENQEGVDNIDSILEVADGLMVARGDLGVEIDVEDIPLVQKLLIKKANEMGKNVITATQMLDSMIRNPRPTRAEVTDIANAIIDGTSAIMLSGETASGKYPVEAVKTMRKIALRIEDSIDYEAGLKNLKDEMTTTFAIGKATAQAAYDLNVKAIITATSSGYTSKAISKFRPKAPIIAATTTEAVRRKLSLVWGVYSVLSEITEKTDEVIDESLKAAMDAGYIDAGDVVVITAGVPVGIAGSTNLLKVHTIGRVLGKGMGIGQKSSYGRICAVKDVEELIENFRDGDIIVTQAFDRDMTKFAGRSNGIIAGEGGLTSPAAIVGLNLGVPTIVGFENSLDQLRTGDYITLDAKTGQVFAGEARVL
ncbi:MAG: pyruvate kinase [Tissierellia bacterium]|nr:pyruvate kinase [Tissierellia bacterium]